MTETGFPIARELVGSQVELRQANVYDLTPEEFGTFDLVLFLGVLYHLRDPMLALDRIADVSVGKLILETQAIDDALALNSFSSSGSAGATTVCESAYAMPARTRAMKTARV